MASTRSISSTVAPSTPPLDAKSLSLDVDAQAPTSTTPDADSQSFVVSKGRRAALLAIMAAAQFTDIISVSGMFISVVQTSTDLGLSLAQAVWIVTAYSITFASFLLFFGRVADLFSPIRIFSGGFAVLGVLSLGSSFTSNKVAFLILRALAGIGGAATIPSAINLIVALFPEPTEQAAALGVFALTGGVANVIGLFAAGLTLLASWRWFLRLISIIAIPLSALAIFLLPRAPKAAKPLLEEDEDDQTPTWRRLDYVGSIWITCTLVLFILGMTNGSVDGWSSAGFLAPLLISLVLLAPGFFVYESRLKPSHAIFPSTIYSIPNVGALALASLLPYGYFGTIQNQLATYYQEISHYSGINSAVHLLPMGLISLLAGGIVTGIPRLQSKPQINIPLGFVLGAVGNILIIQSDGGHGSDFWRWQLPGMLIGSAGMIVCYAGLNVGFIMAFPAEKAGLAGGIFNMLLQVGAVTLLSIQSGLMTTGDGLQDWKSSANGFWMVIAFLLAFAVAFAALYRPRRNLSAEPTPATSVEKRVEAAIISAV